MQFTTILASLIVTRRIVGDWWQTEMDF